jgi:hypothetical protein
VKLDPNTHKCMHSVLALKLGVTCIINDTVHCVLSQCGGSAAHRMHGLVSHLLHAISTEMEFQDSEVQF